MLKKEFDAQFKITGETRTNFPIL